MRASLASATSLLALLVMEGHEASAYTISVATSPLSFGYVLQNTTSTLTDVASLSGGNSGTIVFGAAASPFGPTTAQSGTGRSLTGTFTFSPSATGAATPSIVQVTNSGASNTATITLTGTGVAPVSSGPATSAIVPSYVLVNSTLSNAVTLTVSNVGNAYLISPTTKNTNYNLNGTITGGNSVFSGTAATIALQDSHYTGSAGASSGTYSFAFTPTIQGQNTASVTTTFSNGGNGANTASTITSTLTGTGVAPVAAVSAATAGYVLVGSTSNAVVTVNNTGNGNLSNAGTISNLRGSVGSLSSSGGFSGAGGTLSHGSTIGLLDTSSATYTYAYTPTTRGASSALVVSSLANGSANLMNNASSLTTTLTGTGVAPVQAVANSTVFGRLGSGSVSNGTITVSNIGDGNLAGTGTGFNLNGSISAFSSGSFSGSAQTISLASNATGSTSSTATSTLGYTYTPGSTRGSSSLSATIAFSDGNSAGTNLSQSVTATLTGSSVGPTYASTLNGSATAFPTSPKGTGTVAGAAVGTIAFGTVSYKDAVTLYLALGNTTTDANGGNALLTDLTIDQYTITGTNASSFTVGSIGGSVITEGGELLVPITVYSTTAFGSLSSSLTIFTDESTGLGGYGDNFTYALTAVSAPEPASLAVFGAGLVGLAGFRRRKRAAE